MKATKYMYGILVVCVSALMLIQNVAGAGPGIAWGAQATLSTVDVLASQDPENSGYGLLQVSVWEEWNGADWDIYMKTSNADGAPGTWVFPALHPATTAADEINPAVSVTRNHAVLGQEIHVVYQRWNAANNIWEICHTYTPYPVIAWTAPVVISSGGLSATNPACVYSEDQAIPGGGVNPGTLVQIVWEEVNPGPAGGTQIMYRAFAYDPTLAPVRFYVPDIVAAPFIIRTPPGAGSTCELPEIASVDERASAAAYDYYFSIVWQEFTFTPVIGWTWEIYYLDGTTTTSAVGIPPPPIVISAPGALSVPAAATQHTDPDIAASQDYQPLGLAQSYFFHVDYFLQGPNLGGGTLFSVEQCYSYGAFPNPGFAAFSLPASVYSAVTILVPPPILIDNPTIATKLTSPIGAVPITFDTWFAWEDSTAAATTDIWYRAGTYTTGPPAVFFYFVAGTGKMHHEQIHR